jgi:two-component system OmpR family response regulator
MSGLGGDNAGRHDVRVLVAEDDRGLREVLSRGLRENCYTVDAVSDGAAAMRFLRSYEYAIAVLDWRMPEVSGLEVLKWLRSHDAPTAVLMLTARDAHADRVAGLDAGADDYLVKPFDFDELLARMRALQRRLSTSRAPLLTVGDLRLDPATREVWAVGSPLSLTATELGILEALMRHSPAVMRRRTIAQHVWDHEADAMGSNTIDVHLTRLRSKLTGSGVRIQTVRGVGFRILPP